MLASVDSALKAWTDCEPQGYTLEARRLPEVLDKISACVPCNHGALETSRRLQDLFARERDLGDGMPLFLEMVKEQDGQINFLYFWQAFSKAVRYVGGGEPGAGTHESLLSDFESLRDRVLRRLDMDCVAEPDAAAHKVLNVVDIDCLERVQGLSASEIKQLVLDTANMSEMPSFWNSAIDALDIDAVCGDAAAFLQLEELTALMLQWIYNAVTLRLNSPAKRKQESLDAYVRAHSPTSRAQGKHRRTVVRLHIYDVSHEGTIHQLNKLLANKDAPFKLGGAFHTGVEVNDLEWCFGYSGSSTKPGIACIVPKSHPHHNFRQTVKVGYTTLTPEEISVVISGLIEDYPGTDYDLFSRNCCHFADDFCQRLGVGTIPAWIHRFSFLGTRVANAMHAAKSIGNHIDGALQEVKGFHNRNFGPLPTPDYDAGPKIMLVTI